MRKDLGMNEISDSMEQKNIEEQTAEEGETGKVVDSRSLNNMIEHYLKNKKD
jgi:hypothetical protein